MQVFSVFGSSQTNRSQTLLATLAMAILVSIGTYHFWQFLKEQQQQDLRSQFEIVVSEMKTKVAERMTAYGQVLKGGRSLFYGSDEVSRDEWFKYVSTLELGEDYPGIQGVGFSIAVPAERLAAHQAQVRGEGFPDYRVWPEGERNLYSAIIYLEPFDWRNRRAFGYDMFFEPTRNEAMVRARDTGEPALSGKVLLVQETNEAPQAGTLLYIPLYREGASLENVEQRRKALVGWVYSPYRMDNLIGGMLGKYSNLIRLRIYDEEDDPDRLLYDSVDGDAADDDSHEVHEHLVINVAGRDWVLDFDSLPGFGKSATADSLYGQGVGVALIGLLLVMLTWTLFNTQYRAGLMARKLTTSLRESEERWGFALEGSGDGVWDWDIDSGKVYFSSRFRQMLGMEEGDPEDLDTWREHIHPEDEERVNEALNRHLNGDTSEYVAEKRVQHADGHYIWVLARGKVTSRDQFGRPLRLVGTYTDITERKQAEEQIRLLSEAILQSGEAVTIINAEWIIEYVNPSFCKMTGFSKEEVVGQRAGLIGLEESPEIKEAVWGTVSSGKTWQGRIEESRKDGSIYPAMLTVSPIISPEGAITHYVAIQQGLSEYEELEAKFYQSQKMEAVGTLVGGIAHDFNNTLAAIVGNLYLAKQEAMELPKVVARLAAIERLSFQAAEVIKQLLTFSRKSKTDMGMIALVPFIKESIKLNRVTLPENIELELDICTDELTIQGDINLLQQVLINLLTNARDAVQGTKDPVIKVRLEKFMADARFKAMHPQISTDAFAHIRVRDNGHGIKKENVELLFDPFFTTKGVNEGTGLGLSMVYGAVELHQGVITVDSGEGEGACFDIYLPLSNAADPPEEDVDSSRVAEGHGETVLLVDDSEELLEASRHVLESLNYKVVTASNGRESVDIYSSRHDEIDLVILDVVMPQMGGTEAYRLIRQINPHARVMFATGYDRSNVLQDEDMTDIPVIAKPFAVVELSQAIDRMLAE